MQQRWPLLHVAATTIYTVTSETCARCLRCYSADTCRERKKATRSGNYARPRAMRDARARPLPSGSGCDTPKLAPAVHPILFFGYLPARVNHQKATLAYCNDARPRAQCARPLPSGGGCCDLPTTEPLPVSSVSSKLLLLTQRCVDRAQLVCVTARTRCATRARGRCRRGAAAASC